MTQLTTRATLTLLATLFVACEGQPKQDDPQTAAEQAADVAAADIAGATAATPALPIPEARQHVNTALRAALDLEALRVEFLLANLEPVADGAEVPDVMAFEPNLAEPPAEPAVDDAAPVEHAAGPNAEGGLHTTQRERLEEAAEHYRAVAEAGGWPQLPEEPDAKALKARLAQEGWKSLEGFQEAHQLEVTGTMNPSTRKALNVGAWTRLAQIEVALEKHRKAGHHDDPRFVMVNVLDFHVELWENGKRTVRLRSIVGTNKHKGKNRQLLSATPLLSSTIETVVVNPSWIVPIRIQNTSVAKNIRKDPNYLQKNGFEQRKTSSGKTYLRQKPGPLNALGRFKFLFKNSHSVYMHDTLRKELFDTPVRAYSYGCVRLSQPDVLARALLAGDDKAPDFEALLSESPAREQHFTLSTPVPIHIEYVTVRVDDALHVHFLNDIYGYDAKAVAAAEKRLKK